VELRQFVHITISKTVVPLTISLRYILRMTTQPDDHSHLPLGATEAGEWSAYGGAGGIQGRLVKWADYDEGNVSVSGRQWPDGDVDAAVSVWVGDGAELDGITTTPTDMGYRPDH
jgi:hypothetical protein